MTSQGWREIGDKRIFARSIWEANYARYLEWQKQNGEILDWFHEPKTFWFEGIKRGCVSYKPDFYVVTWNEDDKQDFYVEVKGYYDRKSLTKIKRFRKYFPDQALTLIDKKWFTQNNARMRLIIKDWEKGECPKKKFKRLCTTQTS